MTTPAPGDAQRRGRLRLQPPPRSRLAQLRLRPRLQPPPRLAQVRLRPRSFKRGVLAAGLILLSTGCVSNASQDSLKAHGSIAQLENSLLFPVFWIAVGVFCLIAGLVGYCVVKFKARTDDEAPRQVHGNTRAEITWTILPAVLLAAIAIPTVKFVFDLNQFPANAPVIAVTGHRWWWQMDYTSPSDPNSVEFSTATVMHIPTKTKVVVTLTSVDVIHNFWVPELAGKLYAIPGRHNKLVIEADTPGTYYGQCSEYCGTSHANMRLEVVAESPAQYQAWLTEQEAPPVMPVSATTPASAAAPAAATSTATPATPATPAAATSTTPGDPVALGFQDFKSIGCAGCHTITGVSDGVVGPNLTHFKSRSVFAGAIFANTDNNLRLWLANPPLEKPGSVMPDLHLTQPQITQLIAYLDTLQ